MDTTETQISSEDEGSAPKTETRPGAFIVLALAVLGGGGYLFYKNGPGKAAAATPGAAVTSDAQKSIAEFLQVQGSDVSSIQKGLSNTERVVKQFNSYASMTQIPLAELSSNPFKAEIPETPAEPAATQPAPHADEAARAEALKKATDAAANLRIESILIGKKAAPSAMINGQFVRVGDKIEGFKVESIKPGVVLLTDGQFHFERHLQGQ